MDLNKLTIKSQAALEGAHQQAVARNHQTIEPEHVLFALLSDPEGVVYPLLHQIGVTPKTVRDQVDQALDRIPKVYAQGRRPTCGSRRRPARLLDRPAREAEALTDEYVSTEHLLLALLDGRLGRVADPEGRRAHARRRAGGARRGARAPARHRPEPRGEVPGARAVRPRPDRAGARAASSTR